MDIKELYTGDIKKGFNLLVEINYRSKIKREIMDAGLYEPHEADEFIINMDGSAHNPILKKWYQSDLTFEDFYAESKGKL